MSRDVACGAARFLVPRLFHPCWQACMLAVGDVCTALHLRQAQLGGWREGQAQGVVVFGDNGAPLLRLPECPYRVYPGHVNPFRVLVSDMVEADIIRPGRLDAHFPSERRSAFRL